MIVVGLDPGVQRAGYAVLEVSGRRLIVHEIALWNLLGTGKCRPSVGERLELLHKEAAKLFSKWNPQVIGLEKAITFRNVASAHLLSEARGVLRLAAHQSLADAERRLVELSPTAVKKTASGWGRSSKLGMLKFLSLRFSGLENFARNEGLGHDAIDALAIAFTAWCQSRTPLNNREKSVRKDLEGAL